VRFGFGSWWPVGSLRNACGNGQGVIELLIEVLGTVVYDRFSSVLAPSFTTGYAARGTLIAEARSRAFSPPAA
jgi:hypothetical protein